MTRQEYDELCQSIPHWDGDQHWANRLETWEDFLSNGPIVARLLRKLKTLTPPDVWEAEIYSIHPKLCDVVLEHFPEH